MTHYRIYSVDERGSIEKGRDAECDSDDDAFAIARQVLGPQARLELWSGRRLVGCLSGIDAVLWWPKKAPNAQAVA